MTHERTDPVIDEVREIRRRISARFGHDPARLVAYYMELQKRHSDRMVDRPREEPGDGTRRRAGESSATPSS